MKAVLLVGMLLALLLTAWLVLRDLSERRAGGGAPAAITTIERAAEAGRKVDAANQAQERRLEGAARE